MGRARRDQGLGSVFRHKGCRRWQIQYYVDGKPVREATGLTSRVEAQKILTDRLSAVAHGQPMTVRPVRVSELYDHLLKHNTSNGKPTESARWEHLQPYWGNVLASRITSAMVLEYRNRRTEQKAAVATINRELAFLRHMLKLGHQDGLIAAAPHIKLAPENNIREGFVSDAKLDELRRAAAKELWLRTFVELASVYGWRRGELLNLRVSQVDFAANLVRLAVGTTKNKKGREAPMTPTVRALLQECCRGKKADDRVLTRKDGTPARDVRCAWRNLCCSVGLGRWACTTPGCGVEQAEQGRCPRCKNRAWEYRGLLVHDMRRTAVRNLRRAGVAEQVAMSISGHKTSSIFRRYDIVNNDDKVLALQQLQKAQDASSGKVVVKAPVPRVQNHEKVQ
jgi:integrase